MSFEMEPDMSEEDHSLSEETGRELTVVDLVELIQDIEHKYITELVKRNKHLSQRVFRGFRPNHLPWKQVPDRLARDAQGDLHKVGALLELWQKSNSGLVEEVAEVTVDSLQEEVVRLLTQHGMESKGKILWALRLDERPEIQEALTLELKQELSGEASSPFGQVLQELLATTQKELDDAKTELEKQRRRAQQKTGQAVEWREKYEAVVARKKHLQAQIEQLENQRKADQDSLYHLQRQLDEEQASTQELRRSVTDLKASLRRQVEEQDSSEILLELEAERKTSAILRLKAEKLEQQRGDAYAKRDQVLEQAEALRQKLEQAQHDKNVIIDQKRQLQEQLEESQAKFRELQSRQDEETFKPILEAIPVTGCEAVWLEAQATVREHLRDVLSALGVGDEAQVTMDKMTAWQSWVTEESRLVEETLTSLDAYPETAALPDMARLKEAQQLLVLRWYLLEYTRLAIEYTEQQTILSF